MIDELMDSLIVEKLPTLEVRDQMLAELVRGAEAYQDQRVLRARGDADKFNAMLVEYQKARGVTRQRLYLETMERVLGPIKRKMIVDQAVGDGTVPLLPLRGGPGGGPAAATVATGATGATGGEQ